ncbi:MAG: DUF5399 family protein [Chlamydiales bacterium]|nr:DUF5399 family protein [Chlamydiales bacterium]
MTTIDNFDIKVHISYAQRTEFVEAIRKEFRLDQAASIPPQIQVIDFQPKPAEIDLLLGVARVLTPWALFLPPPRFRTRRRSPFTVARVIPTLGSQDKQDEQEEKIAHTECETAEDEREKTILLSCFQTITKINDWLGHIVSRIGQFLQA